MAFCVTAGVRRGAAAREARWLTEAQSVCCCWDCWWPWHKVRCWVPPLCCVRVGLTNGLHPSRWLQLPRNLQAARRHFIRLHSDWTARSKYSGNGVELPLAGQPSLGTGEDALDSGVFGDEAAISDAPVTPPVQLPIAERARQVRAWPCESWPALRVAASLCCFALGWCTRNGFNALHPTQGRTRRRPLRTRRTSACRASSRPGPPRPAQRPHPRLRPSPVRSAQRGAAAGCCLLGSASGRLVARGGGATHPRLPLRTVPLPHSCTCAL